MKKLVIGLFVLGLTSLGFSQNLENEFVISEMAFNNSVALNTRISTPAIKKEGATTLINSSYISSVQDDTMSKLVRLLEDKASRFDITNSNRFDGRSNPFKVEFNSNIGSIEAMYSSDGQILNTVEKYEDVKLSVPVRTCVLKAYPGWSIQNSTYMVFYKDGHDTKKIYKVFLEKNNLKKTIKIDASGNLL